MTVQMNKSSLLDEMSSGYTVLDNTLATLGRQQMTTPGVTGDWSIKDILAHLTAWQDYLLIRLQAAARNEAPPVQAVLGAEDEDSATDKINAHFYEENKFRPLGKVMADFRSTYEQVVEAVQALSDEDLFEPKRFAWMKNYPLWELVAGNTYEHYQEHLQSIQQWLSKSS
ncbi:MAG TPA: ClbS/DfsB family four-helix bundle protein [Ktedonobacteraceae bacterium]|nr:ClbS/DfsB family four-helix bundle protein [Ktedonobacteraceae bacterium]